MDQAFAVIRQHLNLRAKIIRQLIKVLPLHIKVIGNLALLRIWWKWNLYL